MKYNEKNKPLVCMMTQSTCYKGTRKFTPKGVLWHSTGANNPNLKRYVQPDDNAADRSEWLARLGKNQYNNDWNHIERQAGLNFWIGKLADGTVAAVQTMPWDFRPWGCGSGSKGSCNDTHIQFEICEDGLTNGAYFKDCYNAAVSLCADICRRWGWEADVIVSHKEAYKKGYGSNHADIDHWLKKFRLTMADFRKDVDLLLHPAKVIAVGDTVQFTGSKQYTNANKLIGKKAKPGKAVVKQIYQLGSSRHPYLVKGSGVYGWVNEGDVKP